MHMFPASSAEHGFSLSAITLTAKEPSFWGKKKATGREGGVRGGLG
jgi:hypothetical protein